MSDSNHQSTLSNDTLVTTEAAPVPAATAVPATATPAPAEDKAEGKKRAADRLNIPSAVVRASGFVPGDKVFVVDEDPAGATAKPCLVLLKQQPTTVLADDAVAKDCRIP